LEFALKIVMAYALAAFLCPQLVYYF